MATTMRAVDIHDGKGPPSSLYINSSIERPKPSAEQCLIRVKAFGLNRADTLQREGNYPIPPGVTKILGLEFSGTVEEVGHGSEGEERHNWNVADEVFGLTYGGAYAEFLVVNKKMLLRKPKELSWEVCAGLCETWFTALQALHLVGQYDPTTTKSVLWHAGASSVSIAGIQLSKIANTHTSDPSHSELRPPKVFATARSDAKCEYTKKLGATAAFNTNTYPDSWAEEVTRANDGKPIDLIIDFIGAPYFAQNMAAMALDGRIVQLGVMGGTKLPPDTDISAFVRKRVCFQGSTLRSRAPDYQAKLRDLFEEKVFAGLVNGELDASIDRVVSWHKIAEAHMAMENNETKGKIICLID